MKNRMFIIALAGILMLSFSLAPAASAADPITIAVSLAVVGSLFGFGVKAHKAEQAKKAEAEKMAEAPAQPPLPDGQQVSALAN